jgi:hypothetical protein
MGKGEKQASTQHAKGREIDRPVAQVLNPHCFPTILDGSSVHPHTGTHPPFRTRSTTKYYEATVLYTVVCCYCYCYAAAATAAASCFLCPSFPCRTFLPCCAVQFCTLQCVRCDIHILCEALSSVTAALSRACKHCAAHIIGRMCPFRRPPPLIAIPRHGKSKYLHYQIASRQKRTISKCLFPFPTPTTSPTQPICLSRTTVPLDEAATGASIHLKMLPRSRSAYPQM